jgi:hypothetical protein
MNSHPLEIPRKKMRWCHFAKTILRNWLSIWAMKRPTEVGMRKVVVRRSMAMLLSGAMKTNQVDSIILARKIIIVADLNLPKKYIKNGKIR